MKKTTAALIFASAALVLGACQPSPEDAKYTSETARHVAKMEYVYDQRVDLCFASYDIARSWGFMTEVPCNKKVLQQIAKDSPNGIAQFPNEVFEQAEREDGLRP